MTRRKRTTIASLHGRIGGLTRANNTLRERLKRGDEVCSVCCRSLDNTGYVIGAPDWKAVCTACSKVKVTT